MKKCAFITLGCKVNQYETQAIREVLIKKGYKETSVDKDVDIYVINTCTVTAVSDNKSKQFIRKVQRKNADAKVVVTGCYAEAYKKKSLSDNGTNIIVIEQDKKADIESILDDNGVDSINNSSIFELSISKFEGHTRAFLKIEDGCDNRCSYCIVPYVRGKVKSRPINEVKMEAERLVANGYTEIVLTGIHLGAYGKDFDSAKTHSKSTIVDVIKKLEKISGLKRIRISSIEAYEVTDELISIIANSEKICPHLHLPLQSGDNYILKKMNRRYSVDQFLSLLERVRKEIDLPAFTTDVIVGFPGENALHFENTITTCQKAGFSRIHIFPYSRRDGTIASKMENHCGSDTIMARKKITKSMSNKLAEKYKQNFVGKNLKVLVESKLDNDTGMLYGYTERYVKVAFNGNKEKINTIQTVFGKEVLDKYILGTLV